MLFGHVNSRPGDTFAGINFLEFSTSINALDGSELRTHGAVTAPDFWDQRAVDVLADKYLRKAGVPSATRPVPEEGVPEWLWRREPEAGCTFGPETDVRQALLRMAGCWAYWGWKGGYFDGESSALAFRDEAAWTMARQWWAPNSPQWFNTGIHWAYGIEGSASGQFYWDGSAVRECSDSYSRPQSSACMIQSVEDHLLGSGGIQDLWDREARTFKFGGGSGSNFSLLRGRGEPLTAGGTSSGVMSWLKIGDAAAGSIKSGGATRRAAKMIILDDDHPELPDFILWKVREEEKVAAMITGSRVIAARCSAIARAPTEAARDASCRSAAISGVPQPIIDRVAAMASRGEFSRCAFPVFDHEFEGEAYCTVSGQNANNSVSLSDPFMHSANGSGEWSLANRLDGTRIPADARQLFDDICYAAWACADPGAWFRDNVNAWNTCLADGDVRAANPCGEYLFLDDTSCNLASLNLAHFFGEGVRVARLRHAVRVVVAALDITNDMASFPSAQIARRNSQYRTIGLGYANLGAVLMRLGLGYGSAAGRAVCSLITSLIQSFATSTSAAIARDLAPFPRYGANRDHVLRVMEAHHAYSPAGCGKPEGFKLPAVRWSDLPETLRPAVEAAATEADRALAAVRGHGLRNAEISCIAPTGTIGFVMGCDTTGIEPDFAIAKVKKLAGGGYMKIVNQSVVPALEVLGYPADQIDEVCRYAVGAGTWRGCPHLERLRLACPDLEAVSHRLATAVDVRLLLPGVGQFLSDREIEDVNHHVCGRMTVEGAPHLREEHYHVFDCANRCGLHGKRYLSVGAHLEMMAAAQPFVSMGISKTVNLPNSATVDDVRRVFVESWGMGLKAVPVYRDQSKLSQILNAPAGVGASSAYESPVESGGIARRRPLPSRRLGYVQKVKIGGHSLFIRTGEYEDGTLGEVFLDMAKEGTTVSGLLHHFAICLSVALQCGVPLEEYVDAFVHSQFEPNGVVGGHDSIKMASSLTDMVIRDLAVNYLGRRDLAQVPGTPYRSARQRPVPARLEGAAEAGAAEAGARGYESDACASCGNMTLIRNGRCCKCDTCGATTGCS